MTYQKQRTTEIYQSNGQHDINVLQTKHIYLNGILLTCEKHFYDRIISLRIEVSPENKLIFFIEVSVSSQENERSCICVLMVSTLHFYDVSVAFWNCVEERGII